MEEFFSYATVFGAGLIAGAINTIAGGGSFISLPALIGLGLSPGLANGSNRIAILLQSGVASVVYARAGQLKWRRGLWLAGIASVGAVLGASVAAALSEALFQRIFGVLFVVMSIVLMFKHRLLPNDSPKISKPRFIVACVFIVVGFYGGFIQAGVGILMLLAFTTVLNWEILFANGLKNFIVFLYTIGALVIFAQQDLVDYEAGFVLACGNVLGGYWGAKWSLRRGKKWILGVVVGVALISGIHMLFTPLP